MHDIYEHHIDTQCAWQQIEKNRRWPTFFPFDVGYSDKPGRLVFWKICAPLSHPLSSFSAIDELIPGQN
jgi:hypothetical protein